jgi:transposase
MFSSGWPMTEPEARQIYHQGPEATVRTLLALDARIQELEQRIQELKRSGTNTVLSRSDVTTPSAMKPAYAKPSPKRRRRRPGRPKGHPGARRPVPDRIDEVKSHQLTRCPGCRKGLGKPIEVRRRYIEEIPPVEVKVTEHQIYRYHCSGCRKIVEPVVSDALPKATIGLRTVVFTSWLHYGLGITLSNIVQLLNISAQFRVSQGGLVQAWHRLACLLQPAYQAIGQEARQSAVLHADETGWRVTGLTYWLWCFTNHRLVYYLIDRCRGSPVVKKFLGQFFQGVLITDFYAAYNLLKAAAKSGSRRMHRPLVA